MEEELKNFINVILLIPVSLIYCYFIPNKIAKGSLRLVSVFPVITLFTLLPLKLSARLSGITGFLISWLASFKLLLFAFDQGPLSSSLSLSLMHFVSFACLPIKIKSTSSPQIGNRKPEIGLNTVIKISILVAIFQIYYYKDKLYAPLLFLLFCFQIYFQLEVMSVITTTGAQRLLGLDLEPPFDQPHLSTSLQNFWGKRWNLMVTNILRPTIYHPVRTIASRLLGKECGLTFAVVATFAVSGLMHELIFFYRCRLPPTWEVLWFFVLHGVFVATEIQVKKKLNNKRQLHPVVSIPLTLGFVLVTTLWLFLPQLLRGGTYDRGVKEVLSVVELVSKVGQMAVNFVAKFSM